MEIPRGEITKTVYSLIKDGKCLDAIEILEQLLDLQPDSRSTLSLLGYCNFQVQHFENAVMYYDRLSTLFPEIPEYQYYLAQCLYNMGQYEEALNASYLRGDPNEALVEQVAKLQIAIQYCRDERVDVKALLEKCKRSDPDVDVSQGCLAYKEGNYAEACKHFESASKAIGMKPYLWYNRAVANYQKGDLPSAAHFIGEVIENGVINFPELKMGHIPDETQCIPSVGNTRMLHQSALVETLNLKAAVEFDLKKCMRKAARETLKDLPPRAEEEMDPITLHNVAILNIQADPLEGLRKLRYLLEQNLFPPETFLNLMILYWKYEHYDLMADLLAVYGEFRVKYLSHDMQRFFESLIKHEVAHQEAAEEMETLCMELGKVLVDLVKKVAKIKLYGTEDEIKAICNEFDDIIDGTYMPVLMQIAKIHWDKDDLVKVEEILRLGGEFLDDRDPWLLNCAHVVYRRGKDFKEAAGLYELVVRKYDDELLQVGAASLANLIVCYVTIGANEEAERMLNRIQEQEILLLESHKGMKVFHSCIMSLVIGTLYCTKNNYQFGIDRIFHSMLDVESKLGPDTWFYIKSCILSLIERLVKVKNIVVNELTLADAMILLLKCEDYGRYVTTVIEETGANPLSDEDEFVPKNYGKQTVAYEARYMQCLLRRVKEQILL